MWFMEQKWQMTATIQINQSDMLKQTDIYFLTNSINHKSIVKNKGFPSTENRW